MKMCFSFCWTSSTRPPTGAPPLDPAGGLPSPRPPRSLVQFKNFHKKALALDIDVVDRRETD